MGVETRLVVYKRMPHGITKPRLNRQVMQENLDWFNRWIWEAQAAPKKDLVCYIALAPVKAEDPGEDSLAEVRRQARQDDAEFCIFSGEQGLLRSSTLPPGEHSLAPEQLSERARQVAGQLTASEIGKMVVFIPEGDEQKAQILLALGCLQAAAGAAGSVRYEQRVVKV